MKRTLPPLPEPSESDISAWRDWLQSKPEAVREVGEKLPPWNYYEMPKTGQTVIIDAYAEDGTLRVTVVGDRISTPAIVSFEVFGVCPKDLTPHSSHQKPQ